MSTRGAWGFRLDGQDKVSYVHCDGYPSGWPLDLVRELREKPVSPEAVRNIKLVDSEDRPHPDGQSYYEILKGEAKIGSALESGLMIDSHTFLADSLFCEWAYIINLDAGILEVYRGFQERVSGTEYLAIQHHGLRGRYWGIPKPDSDYMGVALLATFPLNDLPTDGEFTCLEP